MSESKSLSRRNFLRGSALAAGASLVGFQPVLQQVLPVPTRFENDLDILNYALTLEHLEYQFYEQGLMWFLPENFDNLKYTGLQRIRRNLKNIRAHELVHVNTLIQVITSLGGTPVAECTYDFGFTNILEFVKTAQALENTGVMAYTGAIQFISDPALRTAAATIATVEARHAAYLNLLAGPRDIPFPDAFDEPKTEDEILAIAGQFIVSCP